MKNKTEKFILKTDRFLVKHRQELFILLIMSALTFLFLSCPIYADTLGDSKWSTLKDTITTWLKRLGGIAAIMGLVEFGLSFASNNPEGKSLGVKIAIGGIIAFGAGSAGDTFLS